ncbi:unnamed protein product [Closterium sp. NIES-54]
MASLRVLSFDPEGRPVAFDTWHDDLQLYLLSDLKDSVSLFDHVSGAAPAPPATVDVSTRSQWLSRDATARLAISLPSTECAHFGEHRTKQALYDAVIARYSSPTTAAIGRLLLPYLFPELSAFATVADLVTHLRTSNARYRAAVPTNFLPTNQPPMFITLYFIVTRLLDSLRSVRDHFLTLNPTSLTVDLLEKHLLAAETSAVAVGAARGTPRSPFFEGCSPSPLSSSFAFAAAADVSVPEDVGAASTSAKRHNSKGKGGRGSGRGSGGGGGGSGSSSGGSGRGGGGGGGGGSSGTGGSSGGSGGGGGDSGGSGGSGGGGTGVGKSGPQRGGPGCGRGQQQQRRSETQTPQQLREWLVQRGAGASASGTPLGTAPAEALHTFTLDSGASHCFFRDSTTLTPLPAPVPVRLADPSGGPVVARSSTVLPCPVVPSGSLTGLHPPSFSTNLVRTAALQDAMVTTTTPGGQCASICTCTRMGRHLALFTRRPRSSLYTLATEQPQVVASAQVSASGQVAASCSCRLLSQQTLLWHHRLGHPSLPRLRGMHSHLLVSGLLRSLPPLSPSPAPPCLPCVEVRERAVPHSSSFPPTTATMQTLHMDVWGPARVSGQGRGRYFLLVVDDFTRYTTVFSLRSKGEVFAVLIPWIRTVRLQLRERFGQDLPVLCLHSDKGDEFSSDLLRDFCRGEGITQSFTLLDSPQQNGISEHRIGLVMEVARTSMIHAAAPHFLWPFAVRYAAHQLNLWPRVSLPETSPILRWTGKVGDASVFRVWGSRAFVRNTFADKLSARAIPCDVTFDESVPFYRLFPYRSAPPPPPPLFLAPGPPPIDPLPPQGPAPSGWSQVDPLPGTAPVQVGVVLCAAPGAMSRGGASGGAASGGAELGGAGSEGAGSGGAEPGGAEPGGAESEGVECGGAEPRGAALSRGPVGSSPRLSSQQLREWLVRRPHRRSGAPGAGGAGDTGAGGPAVPTGAVGTSGVRCVGAGDPTDPGAAGTVRAGAEVAGVGGPGAGDAGAAEAGVGGTGAGGARAAGAGAVDPRAAGAGDTMWPRPKTAGRAGRAGLQGARGAQGSREAGRAGLQGSMARRAAGHAGRTGQQGAQGCRARRANRAAGRTGLQIPSPPPLHPQQGDGGEVGRAGGEPASPLPAPSPYTEKSGALTERREPASRPVSPVRPAHRVPRSRLRPVPGTHAMALRPSSIPLRVPQPAPPESSHPEVPDPESDLVLAANPHHITNPTVARLLANAVVDPYFESSAASALVAELLDFAAACRLKYATALLTESVSASPPSVGGECALGTDVLEDMQEDFECLAAVVPRFASMLLAPEGDPDAPDIPTPRSYAEAITSPYSSQW